MKKELNTKEMELSSYHEIGHAFVSLRLGKRFKSVCLVEQGLGLANITGGVEHLLNKSSIYYKLFHGTYKINKSFADEIIREISILYGGMVSEYTLIEINPDVPEFQEIAEKINDGQLPGEWKLDSNKINFLSEAYANFFGESAEEVRNKCWEKVRGILEDEWLAVESLVKELQKMKKLSYRQINDLLNNQAFINELKRLNGWLILEEVAAKLNTSEEEVLERKDRGEFSYYNYNGQLFFDPFDFK